MLTRNEAKEEGMLIQVRIKSQIIIMKKAKKLGGSNTMSTMTNIGGIVAKKG